MSKDLYIYMQMNDRPKKCPITSVLIPNTFQVVEWKIAIVGSHQCLTLDLAEFTLFPFL